MNKLKGTTLVLVLMVIQILINLFIIFTIPQMGLLMLIDTALIIFTYVGFNKGIRGWAIFAIVYGLVSALLSFSEGMYINLGLLLLVAGIFGLTDQ